VLLDIETDFYNPYFGSPLHLLHWLNSGGSNHLISFISGGKGDLAWIRKWRLHVVITTVLYNIVAQRSNAAHFYRC
ncbi:MAG: hypothetical protein ACERK9_10000, partial [Deltaproteobacteria bacterium]